MTSSVTACAHSSAQDDTDFDLVKLVIGKSVVLRGIMVGSVAQ